MAQTTSRGLSDAFRPTHRSLGKRPMVEEDTLDTSHKRIRRNHNNSSAMVEQAPYLGGPVQPAYTPVAQVAPQQNIQHPQAQMQMHQQGYGNPQTPPHQNNAPYPMWTANNMPGGIPQMNNHQIQGPGPMWTGNNVPAVIAQCDAQDHVHIVYWVLNNFAHFQHAEGISSCHVHLVPLENIPHTGIITVPRIIRDTWKFAQPSRQDGDDNDIDNADHNENQDADNDNDNDVHDGNQDADDSAHNDNFEDEFAQNDNFEDEFAQNDNLEDEFAQNDNLEDEFAHNDDFEDEFAHNDNFEDGFAQNDNFEDAFAHDDNLEDALALSLTAFLESDDQIPEL